MAKKKLYAHILLDRSGSMDACRDTAIGAFNEYVNSLRLNDSLAARISLTTFDDQSIDLVFDRKKAREMPALTKELFVPRGMTPLNDAIARTASEMDKAKREDGEAVAFVILTDGLENASREYNRDAVQKLLARLQSEKNWLVVYLGANQDAFAEGAARGVAPTHSMNFDTQRMPAAVGAAARMSAEYAASARPASVAFTEAERAASRAK